MSILNTFLTFKKEYVLAQVTYVRNAAHFLYLCDTFPRQTKELKRQCYNRRTMGKEKPTCKKLFIFFYGFKDKKSKLIGSMRTTIWPPQPNVRCRFRYAQVRKEFRSEQVSVLDQTAQNSMYNQAVSVNTDCPM